MTEYALDDLQVRQETVLWDGSDVVEFRTHVDGSIGHDRLLRVRFAANVPGGLPVFQTGLSVIGRPPGDAEIDVAEHTYTLDNPAHEWFGIGSTARVTLTGRAGERRSHAIGVAEVIAPADPATDGFAPRDAGAGAGIGVRQAVRDLMVALARQGVTATCSVPEGPRYGSAELDSNLPDVRITLGGPETNDFTAQALAAAGPAAADELASQVAATGSGRIWLPGARSRRDALAPGADVRGQADLPVLVVAGTDLRAAIAAVTEDLADAQVEAAWPGYAWDDEPGLAAQTVALLNRGLPGSLVTRSGETFISLMRSCSAWPSGTWIDGEKRTVPDGSSFAWQHWSHTFEYALAAGSGDWRTAGFPALGQEYSHRLLTCETGVHSGPLPATASLASVSPAGVDVMALKPRGNPLAPYAQPDPGAGITMRLRDLAARGATAATIRMRGGISAASETSLLEQEQAGQDRLAGDTATAVVPERGCVTLALRPGPLAGQPPAARPEVTGAPPEIAQPVFTRYWLHGKGPALAGNLPVAVHLSPARCAVRAGQPALLRLTVACGPGAASGTVTVDAPAEFAVTAVPAAGPAAAAAAEQEPAGKLHYHLPANGFAGWDLAVAVPGETRPGRYFLTARILDDSGQLLEDAVLVEVGELGAGAGRAAARGTRGRPGAGQRRRGGRGRAHHAQRSPRAAPWRPRGDRRAAVQRGRDRAARRSPADLVARQLGRRAAVGDRVHGRPWRPGHAALRRADPARRPARPAVVGAGQGDVLRPAPLQRAHLGQRQPVTARPRYGEKGQISTSTLMAHDLGYRGGAG